MRVAAAVVTVASIYIFAPWQAGIYYFMPLPATVQQQVDDAVNQGLDGIIVYVHKKGQQAEFYASGWHNRDKKIPANPKALFKIASIGKLYNAAAVAKLVANGTLVLDQTLGHYLPSLVGRIEHADEITLRMLVQHRSGIPNYTDHKDFDWGQALGGDDRLNLIIGSAADFKPNSDYEYSNTNYLLLGKIMDKALGYDKAQYFKRELLAPLGLMHTFFSINDIEIDELMSGYHVGYDEDFKQLDQGYIATAEDVGIFLRALIDGTLFTDEEQEIYSSIYVYEHTGWVLGNSSRAHYHKDIDTVVIQFVNTTGDDTVVMTEGIYNRIVRLLSER